MTGLNNFWLQAVMKLSEQTLVPQQRDSTKAKLERGTAARAPRTARTRHSSPQPSQQSATSEDEGMVIRCCLATRRPAGIWLQVA